MAQQLSNAGFVGVFSVVLTRFLSIDEFGRFSYVMNAVGLGAAVMMAGLQGLAMREFVTDPQHRARTLGSVLLIREVMAIIAVVSLAVVTAFATSASLFWLTLLGLTSLLARVFDAPEILFQSQLDGRSSAGIRMGVATVAFVARLCLAIWHPSVAILIGTFVLEQGVVAALLWRRYRRTTVGELVRFDRRSSRNLAVASVPLSLSGVANQINLKVDVLILQVFLGSASVGVYSAAVRVSELLYVVPVAFMSATFPVLLAASDEQSFRRQLQRAFDGAFWFGVAVIVLIEVVADPLINGLFGLDYSAAVAVLRVHVLACPFVFMAAVLSKWILREDVLWVSVGRHVCGATAAIALNVILVPDHGVLGSAWATVTSYVVASYLFCFFSRRTRAVAWMMTCAMALPLRVVVGRRPFRFRRAA